MAMNRLLSPPETPGPSGSRWHAPPNPPFPSALRGCPLDLSFFRSGRRLESAEVRSFSSPRDSFSIRSFLGFQAGVRHAMVSVLVQGAPPLPSDRIRTLAPFF